ncbi:MAG TPA: alpha/beta hydrolase [Acidimicrobiales bacterium]
MSTVELRTADRLRLAARWWSPAEARADRAVVLVHGFTAGKDAPDVELVALRLAAADWRVLTFDLRGHGASEGLCTLGASERLDVDAAVAAARVDHELVVVVGASLGGVATIDHLAGAPDQAGPTPTVAPADAAVVVGTPAWWRVPRSWRGVLAAALTQTPPGRAFMSRRGGTRVAVRQPRGAPPAERLRAVRCPVAVIHGLDDRFLPAAAAADLYAATGGPRLLDLVPGMGHGFCPAAVAPVEAAVAWAAEATGAGEAAAAPEAPV